MPIVTINDTDKEPNTTEEVANNSQYVFDLNHQTTIRYFYNENNTVEYHSFVIDSDFARMAALAAKTNNIIPAVKLIRFIYKASWNNTLDLRHAVIIARSLARFMG